MERKSTLKELKALRKSVKEIKAVLEQLKTVTARSINTHYCFIKDENGCVISFLENPVIPFKIGESIYLTLGDIYDEDAKNYAFWNSYIRAGNHTKAMPFEVTAVHRNIDNESGDEIAMEDIDVIIAPVSRRVLIEKVKIQTPT